MERKPARIVVISGVPGAGKSTLARELQAELGWPLLAKDEFKERLFDTVGAADAAASRRLSEASYALMFAMAWQLAGLRINCILEGNFRWERTQREFERLNAHAVFTQLWCTATPEVLRERLYARAAAGIRHPGHRDAENLPMLLAESASDALPLPLAGERHIIDTSQGRTATTWHWLSQLRG